MNIVITLTDANEVYDDLFIRRVPDGAKLMMGDLVKSADPSNDDNIEKCICDSFEINEDALAAIAKLADYKDDIYYIIGMYEYSEFTILGNKGEKLQQWREISIKVDKHARK